MPSPYKERVRERGREDLLFDSDRQAYARTESYSGLPAWHGNERKYVAQVCALFRVNLHASLATCTPTMPKLRGFINCGSAA